ncbi:MAG TPA: helix-turn-helix domain-containing protein [Spirochaetia bacterium]|nr:helix-turn-helix domain-containing protein [Spirochaetia bacterium]
MTLFTEPDRTQTRTRRKKKFNLGLFVGDLYNNFEQKIYTGVKQYAREQNANVVCFVGSELYSSTRTNARRNDIYDLVSIYSVDGIVGISSTLGNHIPRERLIDFYRRFAPLPVVSVGVDIEGMPSVRSDNESPMHELMRHLIEDHDCRRIAFVTGREHNPDSRDRLAVYREELAAHQIPVREELIIPGRFTEETGREAVGIILDERNLSCDAIVCGNDYLAIGVMAELSRRGIRVPDQMRVTGYDDLAESRFLSPPLSTIRQPTCAMGVVAARLLLETIHGEASSEETVLPAELVRRVSCGCGGTAGGGFSAAPILPRGALSLREIPAWKERLVTPLMDLIRARFQPGHAYPIDPEWVEEFVDELGQLALDKNEGAFLGAISALFEKSLSCNCEVSIWHEACAFLFGNIIQALPAEKDSAVFKKMYPAVAARLADFGLRRHELTMVKNHENSKRLSTIAKSLVTVSDVGGLKRILMEELPQFAVRSCYIARFEKEHGAASRDFCNLVFAYEDFREVDLTEETLRFLSQELIPGGFKTSGSNVYIVMPYHFEEEHAGFIIYEVDGANEIGIDIFEIMTVQIGNTLKVIDLYGKLGVGHGPEKNEPEIKYRKSKLSREKSQAYFQKLTRFMEDKKKYTDPDMTPDYLAEKLNISRHNLSYIINEYAGLNFYDFINTYRVKEMIERLKHADQKQEKVIDMAMDCGFKSKSTFNKIFKKHTNMTPTEFIDMLDKRNGAMNTADELNNDSPLFRLLNN